jgi:hypothetical protein
MQTVNLPLIPTLRITPTDVSSFAGPPPRRGRRVAVARDVDVLRFERDDQGRLQILIADMKSTVDPCEGVKLFLLPGVLIARRIYQNPTRQRGTRLLTQNSGERLQKACPALTRRVLINPLTFVSCYKLRVIRWV